MSAGKPKSYNVTLIAEAGTASLTVEAESAQEAIEIALAGVAAAFQRATQWHVSEIDRSTES